MARRDPDAFTEFVAARGGALHRTAYLIVGDAQLAQDLVQEALTKTYVAWPRLKLEQAAEGYTRKAMVTTAISWFRRKQWSSERPHEYVPETATGQCVDSVADREWLWRELLLLPPRQRAAIVLRYYDDLTEAQTAEVMGCAIGTVKSQVAAGLAKLRERLGDDRVGALPLSASAKDVMSS